MSSSTTTYIRGIEKLFRGIITYRHRWKDNMVKEFIRVRDDPSPTAVFVTCVDSRMLPSRFTQTNVGDMFIVRNVGNLVPHVRDFDPYNPSPEPGALELGCAVNNIAHVIVCGHSDCKAMNLLYSMKDEVDHDFSSSPIKAWLHKHAYTSLQRYLELEKSFFRKPLMIRAESPLRQFPAYIDIDSLFSHTDKLSQVNTLLQMENIASYPFMIDCTRSGKTHLHAMWFDIFTGEIYFFSRRRKHFLPILDSGVDLLLAELNGDANLFDRSDAIAIVDAMKQQIESTEDNCCK